MASTGRSRAISFDDNKMEDIQSAANIVANGAVVQANDQIAPINVNPQEAAVEQQVNLPAGLQRPVLRRQVGFYHLVAPNIAAVPMENQIEPMEDIRNVQNQAVLTYK